MSLRRDAVVSGVANMLWSGSLLPFIDCLVACVSGRGAGGGVRKFV